MSQRLFGGIRIARRGLAPQLRPRAQLRLNHELPPSSPPPASAQTRSRLERFNSRLPRFVHPYTAALANAPVSHITAFLLLHELTAVIPLFGLAATFHYTNWLPPFFSEGVWIKNGIEKFGKWARKKQWIDDREMYELREEEELRGGSGDGSDDKEGIWGTRWMRGRSKKQVAGKTWRVGEDGVRWVVEIATAWAVVKALLLPRVALSVWATPWFARIAVLPVAAQMRRMVGRGKSKR